MTWRPRTARKRKAKSCGGDFDRRQASSGVLFALDVCRLHDRPPFCDFRFLQCAQRSRRAIGRVGKAQAERGQSLANQWIAKRVRCWGVEFATIWGAIPFGARRPCQTSTDILIVSPKNEWPSRLRMPGTNPWRRGTRAGPAERPLAWRGLMRLPGKPAARARLRMNRHPPRQKSLRHPRAAARARRC